MPEHTDVPKEAVEALARERWKRDQEIAGRSLTWDALSADARLPWLATARRFLQAAAPAIRKQERERVRAILEVLADAWEDCAARRFKAMGDPPSLTLQGEGEAFATTANMLRERLAALDQEASHD